MDIIFWPKPKLNITASEDQIAYIHSDFTDPQIIHGTRDRVLRIVPVLSYNPVLQGDHFVNVSKNSISSITIRIKQHDGEAMQFNPGYVLIQLLFRPKKHSLPY